ncbi:MAG: hypothetical protein KGI41_02470 [Patescibacteria group bacterium]|nr:hypothetical protein [Patescibacteria group bacterium]MDE1966079.1 hypothetical protein [Patescibacteria group bacterium]
MANDDVEFPPGSGKKGKKGKPKPKSAGHGMDALAAHPLAGSAETPISESETAPESEQVLEPDYEAYARRLIDEAMAAGRAPTKEEVLEKMHAAGIIPDAGNEILAQVHTEIALEDAAKSDRTPMTEPALPGGESLERAAAAKIVPLEDLEAIVRKQLRGKAKITSLVVEPTPEGAHIAAKLDAGLLGGAITLNGTIANDGDSLAIRDLNIQARGFVEGMIKDNLANFNDAIKAHFTKEYGAPVSSLRVTPEGLAVGLEAAELQTQPVSEPVSAPESVYEEPLPKQPGKIDDYEMRKTQPKSAEQARLDAQRAAYEARRAEHDEGRSEPISLDALSDSEESEQGGGAREYEALHETLARLVKQFPEAKDKVIETGSEKFKALGGYLGGRFAGVGEKMRALGEWALPAVSSASSTLKALREGIGKGAKGAMSAARATGEALGVVSGKGKEAFAFTTEKGKALSAFLKDRERTNGEKALVSLKWMGSRVKDVAEWYRHLPMKYKLAVSATLGASALGLSFAGAGAAWLYTISSAMAAQRALGGAATYTAMEGVIENLYGKMEKNAGMTERHVAVSIAKHTAALVAGLLVGSGMAGAAVKEVFEVAGGDELIGWVEHMWSEGVANVVSAEHAALHALNAGVPSDHVTIDIAPPGAGHAIDPAALAAKRTAAGMQPFLGHVSPAGTFEAGHLAGVETHLSPGPAPIVEVPTAPMQWSPVEVSAGRGYEQMLLGLKAQALAHKAEILAAHGGDMSKVPEATRLLLTEKVHVIASEGGFPHDVALGAKLSIAPDGGHFTIDTGHGPSPVPHAVPVPEARPEPIVPGAEAHSALPLSEHQVTEKLNQWYYEHPGNADVQVTVHPDGTVTPDGPLHVPATPAAPPPMPGAEHPPAAPSAAPTGSETAVHGAAAQPEATTTHAPEAPQISHAVASLEEGPPFPSHDGSFTIDPSKPELYGYTYGDHKVLFVSGGGVGDTGLKARLDYVQQYVAKDPRFHGANIYMDASELKPGGVSVEDVGQLSIDQNGVVSIGQPTVYDALLQHKMPLPDPHTDFDQKFNVVPSAM